MEMDDNCSKGEAGETTTLSEILTSSGMVVNNVDGSLSMDDDSGNTEEYVSNIVSYYYYYYYYCYYYVLPTGLILILNSLLKKYLKIIGWK